MITLYDTAAELSATAADLAAAIDTDEATYALACRAGSLLADLNAGLGIGTLPEPADLAQIARQLIDLNEAIARKLTVIYSRGWREEPAQAEALFDAAPYRRNPR